jgi:hypothetical protein
MSCRQAFPGSVNHHPVRVTPFARSISSPARNGTSPDSGNGSFVGDAPGCLGQGDGARCCGEVCRSRGRRSWQRLPVCRKHPCSRTPRRTSSIAWRAEKATGTAAGAFFATGGGGERCRCPKRTWDYRMWPLPARTWRWVSRFRDGQAVVMGAQPPLEEDVAAEE